MAWSSVYRALYPQWQLVYAIDRAHWDLDRSASALDLQGDWKLYRTISAAYPAAD